MPADTTNEALTIPTHDPADAKSRTDQERARELIELESQFPPPEEGACIPDARWYEANAAALYEQYKGMHVAILNGAVVGHDWSELQLRLDTARKHNVHPCRVLVVHLFSVFW